MQAIITKYIPCTDHRGSRVKATCQAKSVTIPWDHALDPEGNHDAAAKALATVLSWDGAWFSGALPDGTGYCYVRRSMESDLAACFMIDVVKYLPPARRKKEESEPRK